MEQTLASDAFDAAALFYHLVQELGVVTAVALPLTAPVRRLHSWPSYTLCGGWLKAARAVILAVRLAPTAHV